MHFSEAALFSLLEFIFRSCRPYNLLLRIDVNFPLWIDHFFFFFVYGYNEAKTPANSEWFLELHLIYHQYLELIVCLQFIECRIELFIFNLIVKWTSDHFDSGFERFSHQSLAFVYYSENLRSRLFKVIIKLLCAHCFSSLGTLYFFFLRVKKSFLSVSRCTLGSGDQYLKHLF